MVNRPRFRQLGVLVWLVVAGCGGEGSAPESPPPPPPAPTLTLSTSVLDDTIGAVVQNPIVVKVRRDTTPVAGADVRVSVTSASPSDTVASIGAAASGSFAETMIAKTDASGSVAVYVSYGIKPGGGTIGVEVPSLSLRDSARFTVRPGHLWQASIEPRDTAVFVGNQLRLRISLRDRAGNAVADHAEVSDISGLTATTAPDVFVAQPVVTRGRIILRTSLRTDTVLVSVVPRDTMLFVWWHLNPPSSAYRLASVGLDGTIVHSFGPPIFDGPLLNPSWSADGLRALSNYGGDYGTSGIVAKMYLYDTTSSRTELAANNPAIVERLNGHFSRAGDWIFFYSIAPDESRGVWRVRPDGSGLEQLINQPLSDFIYGAYPFADGKSVLVIKRSTTGNHGYALDVATHALTDMGPMNDPVSISPRGDQVAWLDNYSDVRVRSIAGGVARTVAAGLELVFTPPAWTRDGSFVVHGSTLIDVTSGAQIPLPWVRSNTFLFSNASARP